jgi:exopolysaccharide biosynthesis polyprenyl glycosylphosphotransferase
VRTSPRGRATARRPIDLVEPRLLERDVRAPAGPRVSLRGLRGGVAHLLHVVALLAIDLVGVALALYLGLVVRALVAGDAVHWGVLWDAVAQWLPFIALVLYLVFASNGLYGRREAQPGGGTVVAGLALTTCVVSAFAIVATDHHFNSYTLILWAFLASAVLVPAMRASYDAICWTTLRLAGVRRRVVLCGEPKEVEAVDAALHAVGSGAIVQTVARVADVATLPAVIAAERPDDVVLARPPDDPDLIEVLEACRRHRVRLRVVPSATALLAHQATYVEGRALPLFEVVPPTIQGLDWLVKRTFDVVVAALLLLLFSPFLLTAALAVRLTSPGPVLYRDRRMGIGERPFDMLKLRSMRDGAHLEQAELESLNEGDGAIFKIREDPRITPVGRVLRRISLDELPQLWNVMRGEMSLVGPRPLPMRDYALLDDWHRKRYLVLPGITGMWQISGRSSLSFDDMVRLDFYYLEHWSVWMDVAILARTPATVLSGRGAF